MTVWTFRSLYAREFVHNLVVVNIYGGKEHDRQNISNCIAHWSPPDWL